MTVPGKATRTLYKGADFELQFRFKEDDVPVPFTNCIFTAGWDPSEDDFFHFEYTDDPSNITYEEDTGIFTLLIPAALTATVPYPESMGFDVDLITDDGHPRWLTGKLLIEERNGGHRS